MSSQPNPDSQSLRPTVRRSSTVPNVEAARRRPITRLRKGLDLQWAAPPLVTKLTTGTLADLIDESLDRYA